MTDRELDALVAEKVMGRLPRDIRVAGSTETVRCYPSPSDKSASDGTWKAAELARYYGAPPYSTDISTALSVIEEMQRRKWRIVMSNDDGGYHFCGWVVEMTLEYGNWVDNEGELGPQNHTLPKAICLAALRALGVEVAAR